MPVYSRGWLFILFLGPSTSYQVTLWEFGEHCEPTELTPAQWRRQSPTQHRMSCSQLVESRECGKMYFWDRKGCGDCCWQSARMKRGRHCHRSQLTGNRSSRNEALASCSYRAQWLPWKSQGMACSSSCLNSEQAFRNCLSPEGPFPFSQKILTEEPKGTEAAKRAWTSCLCSLCWQVHIYSPSPPATLRTCLQTSHRPEAVGCQGSGRGLWILGPPLRNCATLGLKLLVCKMGVTDAMSQSRVLVPERSPE